MEIYNENNQDDLFLESVKMLQEIQKYELIDILDELRSLNHMIDLHSTNPDKIGQFMLLQYKTMRRKYIKLFNTKTNGKKIS
jgi:hypothetical protein